MLIRRPVFYGIIFILIGAKSTLAANRGNHDIGLDLTAGLPHLVSFQISYTGVKNLSFGIGLGSFPGINSILNRQVAFAPVAVDVSGSSDSFNVTSTGQYRFFSVSAFVRWFPFDSGFFTELNVARWKFTADIVGNLNNATSGETYYGAVTGDLDLTQPLLTWAFGYEGGITKNLFFHVGLGVSYLFSPTQSYTTGGSGAIAGDVLGQIDLDEINSDVRSAINQGVDDFRSVTLFIPSIFIGLGWAF